MKDPVYTYNECQDISTPAVSFLPGLLTLLEVQTSEEIICQADKQV